MSLAVAVAMQERLEASAGELELYAWAQTWGQTPPTVTLGYRRPTGAEGWPFVALVPAADVRDLLRDEVERVTVAIAVGLRLDTTARGDDAAGIRAVDALADVVLGILSSPLHYQAQGCPVVADRASRVDAEFTHPTYQIELQIELTRPGG